ncbi:SAM-dependent methyltransferase [Streptacidiphilus sp. PB12-B1b]|uniref:SAM-dependent methyltransferase n=1 Tax=Streptacidiphilus sp. PB12-B1b TaxID=2705012 RepID=UPI0015FA0BD1|nr:SAM-dependent methyltransferase [Streptacidiphilus sp. PB12-B1b]QMU76641.1 SAM-dependent methyltransferase [Streptacidiphilus sp. PB12-B1b]
MISDRKTGDRRPAEQETGIDLQLDRPHSARMYDYYLGGYTNFPADREAAGKAITAFPSALVAARANRRFMHRSTRCLTSLGMTQFLDIGTGIPTSPNLHEIAQRADPSARVVYADNDPIVLAHAAALLHSTPEGRTAYAPGDVTDPAALLHSPDVRRTLDLDRPVALSLNALLHFVPGAQEAHDIVEYFKKELAPGSTLTITHLTGDFDPESIDRLVQIYKAAGTPGTSRTLSEFTAFFAGWTLLEPGVTPTQRWRPDPEDNLGGITDAEASCYAAVARKP